MCKLVVQQLCLDIAPQRPCMATQQALPSWLITSLVTQLSAGNAASKSNKTVTRLASRRIQPSV